MRHVESSSGYSDTDQADLAHDRGISLRNSQEPIRTARTLPLLGMRPTLGMAPVLAPL